MAEIAFQSFMLPNPQAPRPHSAATSTVPRSHGSFPPTPPDRFMPHDYNFSAKACEESSANEDHDESTDQEANRLNAAMTSGRSSISSLPASVVPSTNVFPSAATTNTTSSKFRSPRSGHSRKEADGPKWQDSPFRNPSSVRSMQMRDEDEPIPHHRQRSSGMPRKTSTFSALSSGSITPRKKRRSGKDMPLSPKNIMLVKKEFPLVLLHCSLLPPAIPIKARIPDATLLQAVLPEEYWRRWELLTEKITNDIEVQSRGVLIPHPQADYELLEERLLESLELARPRLRSGHYYGNEDVHEAEESESDAETAVQGAKCQDCGKRVVDDIAGDRKWEIKVFAANGLMRAGAWSAAWNEMEKIDVEVSISLPGEVRREVEERCSQMGIDHELEPEEAQGYECVDAESRRREIYGTPGHDPQEKIDGFSEPTNFYAEVQGGSPAPQRQTSHHVPASNLDLRRSFTNYIFILAQDKRNLVIAVLSLAVVFLALDISASSQQGVYRNLIPTSVSMPALQPVSRCPTSTTESVSILPPVPPGSSVSTATASTSTALTATATATATASTPMCSASTISTPSVDSAAPTRSDIVTGIDIEAPSLSECQGPSSEIIFGG